MSSSPTGLLRESARKLFHLLTLVYLAAYLWLPRPALWLWGWTAFAAAGEAARLALPRMNQVLSAFFSPIMRGEERERVSGIFHTALGASLTVTLFGAFPRIVIGALLCLSFADAAAALVGKAFGRGAYLSGGKTKSLTGSAACLAVALACLRAAGIAWAPALAGAGVCALIEALPFPVNDNSILPVATALALYLTAGHG
jgi:dolichol kinase